MRLALLFVVCFWSLPALGQEMVRWAFEKSDEPNEKIMGTATTKRRAAPADQAFSDDVPGPFIYDPLSQSSRLNRSSASFRPNDPNSRHLASTIDLAKADLKGRSVTIEAFIKPDPDARGDAWIAGKSRAGMTGSELSLQWVHLPNHGQTWHGFGATPPNGNGPRLPAGHYSSSTRLDPQVQAWRHVAVVYDVDKKSVTCWVDYHLSRSIPLEKELDWDDGSFFIGGLPDRWGVLGKIDEVRLCRSALQPHEFQRARRDAISGVSFRSDQRVVPRDAGCYDAKEHFGAAGDGKTDDTDALNSAFHHLTSRVPLAYNTLILPPGEYVVSKMLHCSRFIDVKGAGSDKTKIRLKDESADFADPKRPRPVLRMSSTSGDPGSNRAVNGSSISIYLEGVTIDTGRNNPGAKGLEYHSNNLGRLEDVVIRSGDGSGVIGLDLTHHDVGPALVKRVTVEGFDTGVQINYQEYSMTFENLTLRHQRVVGFLNRGNIVAIRRLLSENRVPSLIGEGANSMITLLDSRLTGMAGAQEAIRSEGALYALRVTTPGYPIALKKRSLLQQKPAEWKDLIVEGPAIDEYVGDKLVRGFGSREGALKLPIEETPLAPDIPIDEWVNLSRFADRKVGDDWGPAVQAAIDSGARLLYAPANLPLRFATPIKLRGRVERIIGFGGEWSWLPTVWKDPGRREQRDQSSGPPPIVIFDDSNSERTVWIDRLGIQSMHHASRGALVLRSSSPGRYTTGREGGKLFLEDVGGADWHFDHAQNVWARQWNPESHAAGPCIHSRGAAIWALGFKTEYESQKLLAETGAKTEILGAFIYPIGKIPADRPIWENRDSSMALIYGTSVYGSNHKLHILDARGTDTKQLGNESLQWAGSRGRMDLFVSE